MLFFAILAVPLNIGGGGVLGKFGGVQFVLDLGRG